MKQKIGPSFLAFFALVCMNIGLGANGSYIELNGIKGESQDRVHEGMEVESFSGAGVPTRPEGSASGRSQRGEFVLVKSTGTTSSLIRNIKAKGSRINAVTLNLKNAGRLQGDLVIRMSGVSVKNYSPGQDLETITFHYEKLAWEYTSSESEGSEGDQSTSSADWEKDP